MIGLTIGFIGCVCLIGYLFHRQRIHEVAIAQLLLKHPELLASEDEG